MIFAGMFPVKILHPWFRRTEAVGRRLVGECGRTQQFQSSARDCGRVI
jgi:hypothetical protein